MSRAVPGTRTLRGQRFLIALLLGAAAGCTKGEVGEAPTPPITHPDLNCNTAPAALANAECRIQLGVEKTEYIQQRGDQDWWVVNVGALPPRAIVHVVAGYKPSAGQDAGNFNTAVNFQINVLDSNNGVPSMSLATGVDAHGSNSPTLLDLTFRYAKSNNDLFILVQDDNQREYDDLSPYSIFVEVIPDPDVNEPNDTPATATPITLTGSAAKMTGSNGGFLATPGDADYYSIQVNYPSCTPTNPQQCPVLYVDVVQDCLTTTCPTPHKYRLEYDLRDPNNVRVATDSAGVGALVSSSAMEVATARLLQTTGTFTLLVRGWIDPNNQALIPPGDLKFKYKVNVIIVPLQDPHEPNNTIADAKGKPSPDLTLAGPGSSGTITGRISFVPDPDYYRVRVSGSSPGPHLLHYVVTPSKLPARFPALPGNKDRQLQVTTEVDGDAGTRAACAAGDAGVCIISANPSNFNYPNAVNLCQATTAQCLQSARFESLDAGTNPNLVDLGNFESILQVPPHSGDVDYLFLFQDEGTNWADDTDYTIFVEWLAEPDPAEAVPDGQRGPTTVGIGPGATPLSAMLSYGIGALDTSLGISPITDVKDYDGRGDDVDTYVVDVPVGAVADARLFFQWRIPTATMTTTPPYDLGIRLGFCVPDAGVDCAAVQTAPLNNPNGQLGLIFDDAAKTSWWNFAPQVTPNEPLYDRTYAPTPLPASVLTVLRDYACGCLESRLVGSTGNARMFISVFPINRTGWLSTYNLPYRVETGYGAVPSYPYTFVSVPGGATISCPAVCGFTKN